MSKWLVIALVIGLCALSAMAQENLPKAEVFAGYQYGRFNVVGTGLNMNGWNGSLTGNFNKWLGVTADFSGNYWNQSASFSGTSVSANIHAYTYTFGPVVSLNHEGAFNPFVHALFGGIHASAGATMPGFSGSQGDSGFAAMLGGGADARLTKHLAVRLVQADWVHYSISAVTGNSNARISTGLVFRF
jgi:hypothetical protein